VYKREYKSEDSKLEAIHKVKANTNINISRICGQKGFHKSKWRKGRTGVPTANGKRQKYPYILN
jgi:hypothetical protein